MRMTDRRADYKETTPFLPFLTFLLFQGLSSIFLNTKDFMDRMFCVEKRSNFHESLFKPTCRNNKLPLFFSHLNFHLKV